MGITSGVYSLESLNITDLLISNTGVYNIKVPTMSFIVFVQCTSLNTFTYL